jgi:hypothetical protein
MPRRPKKSIISPTQQTLPCPVQGCRTQVRSRWGFTQHVQAKHPGMDLQYPGNECDFIHLHSSDLDQSSSPASPPPSPNGYPQDEPDAGIHFRGSDSGPSDSGPVDFDLDENAEPVSADSTEFHPLINGMYINYFCFLNTNSCDKYRRTM